MPGAGPALLVRSGHEDQGVGTRIGPAPVRMIPPTSDPDVTSSGERMFFEFVRDCDLPGVCFHSLRLARHREKPVSEADFVIVGPRGVLVVEVKSGGVTRGDDGRWRYTGRHGVATDPKGPFVQAESAQWALRDRLLELAGRDVVDQLAFGWAVSFPQCRFTARSVEWEDWQIHDARHHGSRLTTKWLDHCLGEWAVKTRKRPAPPSVSRAIEQAMRPHFQVVPSLADSARRVVSQSSVLTDEQLSRLELVEDEPRLVVAGGAGTGKTFLALEIARQHAADGLRTVLMVPSELLATFLRMQPQMDGVVVARTLDRPAHTQRADVLIVDEAQDLMDFEGLDLMSDWVEGGLEDGRWRVFLDDNRQAALLGRFDPEAYELLRGFAKVTPRLRRNCRNTEQVVDHVQMLTGADIGVPTIADGPGVTLEMVANPEAAARMLGAHLDRLRKDGVPDSEITILSPTPGDSCVTLLKPGVRSRVARLSALAGGASGVRPIRLASPTEFKGLESDFVCLIDVRQFGTDERVTDELYVAMTRARASLWIAMDEALRPELDSAIRKHLVGRDST